MEAVHVVGDTHLVVPVLAVPAADRVREIYQGRGEYLHSWQGTICSDTVRSPTLYRDDWSR